MREDVTSTTYEATCDSSSALHVSAPHPGRKRAPGAKRSGDERGQAGDDVLVAGRRGLGGGRRLHDGRHAHHPLGEHAMDHLLERDLGARFLELLTSLLERLVL